MKNREEIAWRKAVKVVRILIGGETAKLLDGIENTRMESDRTLRGMRVASERSLETDASRAKKCRPCNLSDGFLIDMKVTLLNTEGPWR